MAPGSHSVAGLAWLSGRAPHSPRMKHALCMYLCDDGRESVSAWCATINESACEVQYGFNPITQHFGSGGNTGAVPNSQHHQGDAQVVRPAYRHARDGQRVRVDRLDRSFPSKSSGASAAAYITSFTCAIYTFSPGHKLEIQNEEFIRLQFTLQSSHLLSQYVFKLTSFHHPHRSMARVAVKAGAVKKKLHRGMVRAMVRNRKSCTVAR